MSKAFTFMMIFVLLGVSSSAFNLNLESTDCAREKCKYYIDKCTEDRQSFITCPAVIYGCSSRCPNKDDFVCYEFCAVTYDNDPAYNYVNCCHKNNCDVDPIDKCELDKDCTNGFYCHLGKCKVRKEIEEKFLKSIGK